MLPITSNVTHPLCFTAFGLGGEVPAFFYGSSFSEEPGEGLRGAGIFTAWLARVARTWLTWPDLAHPLPCLPECYQFFKYSN